MQPSLMLICSTLLVRARVISLSYVPSRTPIVLLGCRWLIGNGSFGYGETRTHPHCRWRTRWAHHGTRAVTPRPWRTRARGCARVWRYWLRDPVRPKCLPCVRPLGVDGAGACRRRFAGGRIDAGCTGWKRTSADTDRTVAARAL